jgi:hypothetical protein
MLKHIIGLNSRMVYNIDETSCGDWEERTKFEAIVPADLIGTPIDSPVSRKIKHQTMLVCIDAARETIFPLIITTDEYSREVRRGGIEERTDLKIDVGICHGYLKDVLLPHIEDARAGEVVQLSCSWIIVVPISKTIRYKCCPGMM